MIPTGNAPFIAIACGGTGGHLFPGVAVAEKLRERGCDVCLLISQKEVDQNALGSNAEWDVMTLPGVPLLTGNFPLFLRNSWKSFWEVRRFFKKRRPAVVLAMGGFTSAPPIFAGKFLGAVTALHEANSYAGRANRLLASWVDKVFIGYSSAAQQLRNSSILFTGTPVRYQFEPGDPATSRMALGLNPKAPVLLVMGGSQGAAAINNAVVESIPNLITAIPDLQILHLTGTANHEGISKRYAGTAAKVKVLPFLTEMELALGAASLTITRAGASSIAEIAAMQLPSILIPYPTAADDHQYYNARALAQNGAARMIVQSQLSPKLLTSTVLEILTDPFKQEQMKSELRKWHFPDAADQIADSLLKAIEPTRVLATSNTALKLSHG